MKVKKKKTIKFGQTSIEEAIQKVWNERKQRPKVDSKDDPRLGEHDEEFYFRQLRHSAMKSLHPRDEVEKNDEGFVVV